MHPFDRNNSTGDLWNIGKSKIYFYYNLKQTVQQFDAK